MRPQGFDINSTPAFDQPLLFGSRTPSTLHPPLLPLPSSLSSTLGVNFGLRSNNPWDDFVYVLFNRLTDFPRACRTNYSTPKKKKKETNLEMYRSCGLKLPTRAWAWAWHPNSNSWNTRVSQHAHLDPFAFTSLLPFSPVFYCLSCLPFSKLN